MRTMRTITILTALAILSLGAYQAVAHTLFTGDNSCSFCHDTFDAGGAEHSAHPAVGCSECHVDGVGVEPVTVNSCVQCHDVPDMFLLHAPAVYGDPEQQCGYCHEGVANEQHSWSDLKNIFE